MAHQNEGFTIEEDGKSKAVVLVASRPIDPNDIKIDPIKPNGKVVAPTGSDDSGYKDGKVANQEETEDEMRGCCCIDMVDKTEEHIYKAITTNKCILKKVVIVLFVLGYFAYFGYSMYFRFGDEGSWRLLVCTLFLVAIATFRFVKRTSCFKNGKKRIHSFVKSKKAFIWIRRTIRWLLYLAALGLVGWYIGTVAVDHGTRNLVSLSGIFVILAILFLFSNNKRRVNWHTVLWGLCLQFGFALAILQTDWGMYAVNWTSARFEELMSHSDNGAQFIFGPKYIDFYIAFKVVPSVIFFFSFTSILSHYNVLECAVRNIGGFLGFCLDTGAVESINAAANIFIGGIESTVIVYPYLENISSSQLFCTFVSGMSSIAGIAIVVYSGFGIPVEYLISASVMSAPAALVAAKMMHPSRGDEQKVKNIKLYKDKKYKNVMEAMADGGVQGGKVMVHVLLILLLYVSFFAFVNSTISWFGDRAGIEKLTFEKMISYVMWPITYTMGVDSQDCLRVGEMLGTRAVASLGVSYIDMGAYFNNKQQYIKYTSMFNDSRILPNNDVLLPHWNVTLAKGILTDRSELIAAYAQCGFASIPSVGMVLGAFTALAPKRLPEMNRMAFKALLAATLASYITACVAGLLYSA